MKRFWLALGPAIMLVPPWAAASWADRPLIFRVKQSFIVQTVKGKGYVLDQHEAQIAHRGDRLNRLKAGVQTRNGTMSLRSDTQTSELQLAPHTVLRITKIQPDPAGGSRIYLKVEQGSVKINLLPRNFVPPSPTNPPPTQLNGVRASLIPTWQHPTFKATPHI
ncbi:hypothetical protein IQ266_14115 [filamentous cyanobacterium LEGE 11480]|uniref:Uncharacterized protein n=1 Tax=Romeriopsis navalis LEGE 11480 TaxID=2777977 RepID=A0A928VNI5_9CYAN|nr:hypothetical protein [Romeriopsis navalis]MBE9030867.1 hypothetical protein [Romeriopsis navalis LEGE 11480]